MSEFYCDTSTQREMESALRHYLGAGEEVLWTGRPCRSAKSKAQGGLVFFAVFWLGFALFWTISATAIGGPFGLFGIPFLGIGIWMIYNSTAGLKKRYENTVYAVTDSRALILYRSHRGENLIEYRYDRMNNILLSDVNGNVGTIRFEQPYDDYYYGGNRHYGRRRRGYNAMDMGNYAFVLIDDVHTVYRMISERISNK